MGTRHNRFKVFGPCLRMCWATGTKNRLLRQMDFPINSGFHFRGIHWSPEIAGISEGIGYGRVLFEDGRIFFENSEELSGLSK